MSAPLVASKAAAEAWGVPVADARATRVTSYYPWCKRFEVFFVTGPERRQALVAADPAGSVLRFTGERGVPAGVERGARLAALNDLLAAEAGALPGKLSAEELANAIRAFLVDPSGFVASKAFLELQQKSKALDLWTYLAPHLPGADRHSQSERRELFVRACEDPVLDDRGGAWSLDFSYFTRSGAVEKWHVEGDATRITSAVDSVALPPNTFSPPVE
ncbi:MAG: hypothetical protein JNL21_14755 [Myxococcales bacterium]|nr:hypothetical protein [Myxococcales bacterium]